MKPPNIAEIGKYQIIDELGRGGMGVVYSAVDKRIGRRVAIKTLTEGFVGNPEMLARFYEEAKRTGRLKHPNIVTVYDLGDHEGLPYIVMECVEGEPLDRVLKGNTKLPLPARLRIIEEVCSALGYAHQNNVIHRDVKPANIFVQSDGVAKLLDFGIARLQKRDRNTGHTKTGQIIGTVSYMAPERLRDEQIDGRSDIFSAGVVLYQLLTSHLPFGGDDVVVAAKILHDPPETLGAYLHDYPQFLDSIVDHALAKNPSDRYATAEEMGMDLSSVIAELRQEQVLELFPRAEQLVQLQQLTEARNLLQQLLRIDGKHPGAKQLLSQIQQQLSVRQREERVLQVCSKAREALQERRFDQSISLVQDALRLEASSPALANLLDEIKQEKQKKESVDQFLREADAARRKGELERAMIAAQNALRIDKDNSKIIAICNLLARESEEIRNRDECRRLIDSARKGIGGHRFSEALRLLAEVQELDPSHPELQLLFADANTGLNQLRRKELLQRLNEKATLASTPEELHAAALEVQSAMESMPSEASLYSLKAEIDRQLIEHHDRRLVEETVQACGSLPIGEGLERVRRALQQLPGNERLLCLESLLEDRVAQQALIDRRAVYLSQAHDALKNGRFTDAAEVLKNCRLEGIGNSEVDALLDFARREEVEQRRRSLLQSALVEAQSLIRAEAYQEAILLLQPMLERTTDAALRNLLAQAYAGRDSLNERIETVVAAVRGLAEADRQEDAIQLLESQTAPALSSVRVQTALRILRDEPCLAAFETIGRGYALIDSDTNLSQAEAQQLWTDSTNSTTLKSMQSAFLSRKRYMADDAVSISISKARAFLRQRERQAALEALQTAAAMLDHASPELRDQWKRLRDDSKRLSVVARLRGSLKR